LKVTHCSSGFHGSAFPEANVRLFVSGATRSKATWVCDPAAFLLNVTGRDLSRLELEGAGFKLKETFKVVHSRKASGLSLPARSSRSCEIVDGAVFVMIVIFLCLKVLNTA
jgi:hypothetical protein